MILASSGSFNVNFICTIETPKYKQKKLIVITNGKKTNCEIINFLFVYLELKRSKLKMRNTKLKLEDLGIKGSWAVSGGGWAVSGSKVASGWMCGGRARDWKEIMN